MFLKYKSKAHKTKQKNILHLKLRRGGDVMLMEMTRQKDIYLCV